MELYLNFVGEAPVRDIGGCVYAFTMLVDIIGEYVPRTMVG